MQRNPSEHEFGLCPVARSFCVFLVLVFGTSDALDDNARQQLDIPEGTSLLAFMIKSTWLDDENEGYLIAVDAMDDASCQIGFGEWLKNLSQKSIFITRKGYLGMGPLLINAGDQLCILDRVETPSLLRKANDHWINIGAAHVPGLIDNDPKKMVERGELEMQTFSIH